MTIFVLPNKRIETFLLPTLFENMIMSHPLISICLITYNQEQYIRRAIESILAQTEHWNYEIVISDDGSHDKTLAICNEYQQQYPDLIRVITSTSHRGVLSNWYQAIEASKGTYIALLEGDDYWIDPQKLSKQYAILQQNNAIGFVYSDFFYLDEKNEKLIRGMKQYKPSNDLFEETLFNQAMVSSTMMFRRSLFDPVLFQQFIAHRFLTPDLPLFLHFCLVSQGYFLSDITTTYTWRAGSVSRPTTQQEELQFRESIHRIRLFFILKRGKNKKLLLAKNEFIWQKEQLLIAWKYNRYQNAKQLAHAFPFIATWHKDKKLALLAVLSRHQTSFQLFRPYVTRNRSIK